MASSNNTGPNGSTIAIPSAWPPSVRERFEPVRTLGKGGFASVILAKDRQYKNNKSSDAGEQYVAMKVVGGSNDSPTGTTGGNGTASNGGGGGLATTTYAHREIDILKEISHPNIMKVIDVWETTSGGPYSVTMALSYSKGPTLEGLLKYGGALSPTFSRAVISQLIDALSYLHFHAVVHRDIKPDNVIVTGAFTNQDDIWDIMDEQEKKRDQPQNEPEQAKVDRQTTKESDGGDDDDDDKSLKRFDTNASSGTTGGVTSTTDKEEKYWQSLRQKWKVTLIDFGFARALTPQDVASPPLELKNENTKAAFSTRNLLLSAAAANVDTSNHSQRRKVTNRKSLQQKRSSGLGRSQHSNDNNRNGGEDDDNIDNSGSALHVDASVSSSSRQRRFLMSRMDSSIGHSFSHVLQRRMSALGNRNFAAPEIVNNVQHDTTTAAATTKGTANNKSGTTDDTKSPDITQTVSEYVAEYGLMVDAYSLGHTIRYCVTGVPPYMGVEEAIQDEYSLCSMMCGSGGGGKNKKTGQRSPHYRRISESPAEVQRLVSKLCEPNEKNRTSVRKVRRSYPWIYQTYSEKENDESPWVSKSGAEVEYLSCAKHVGTRRAPPTT